ncbi:hypothetical protein PR048_033514 [Dryococelus australis]|uniref:Uncharacterized protein n=1 Tax=Dryococelus australis TaxID=614101 RepID=A0ABQ9G0H0_9NEOP|nr:hypothetical protein PR048_033514 [Dryococelus australis]
MAQQFPASILDAISDRDSNHDGAQPAPKRSRRAHGGGGERSVKEAEQGYRRSVRPADNSRRSKDESNGAATTQVRRHVRNASSQSAWVGLAEQAVYCTGPRIAVDRRCQYFAIPAILGCGVTGSFEFPINRTSGLAATSLFRNLELICPARGKSAGNSQAHAEEYTTCRQVDQKCSFYREQPIGTVTYASKCQLVKEIRKYFPHHNVNVKGLTGKGGFTTMFAKVFFARGFEDMTVDQDVCAYNVFLRNKLLQTNVNEEKVQASQVALSACSVCARALARFKRTRSFHSYEPLGIVGRRVFSGSPVFPAPSFQRRSMFTSLTLIGSQDLAVKSRPNLFTHSLTLKCALIRRVGPRVPESIISHTQGSFQVYVFKIGFEKTKFHSPLYQITIAFKPGESLKELKLYSSPPHETVADEAALSTKRNATFYVCGVEYDGLPVHVGRGTTYTIFSKESCKEFGSGREENTGLDEYFCAAKLGQVLQYYSLYYTLNPNNGKSRSMSEVIRPCIYELAYNLYSAYAKPTNSHSARRCWGRVAERLARSPPAKANRVQSPAGSPDFRKWESCRTMPLVCGAFSGIFRFPRSFIPGAAPYSLQSPSSALETSLLRAGQISSHRTGVLAVADVLMRATRTSAVLSLAANDNAHLVKASISSDVQGRPLPSRGPYSGDVASVFTARPAVCVRCDVRRALRNVMRESHIPSMLATPSEKLFLCKISLQLSAHECGALSLWCESPDLVKLRLQEAEEYPGSRTIAGLHKRLK